MVAVRTNGAYNKFEHESRLSFFALLRPTFNPASAHVEVEAAFIEARSRGVA